MHLLKNRSMRFYFAFFLILTMAIGGSAIASFASGGPTTVTVSGSSLSESGPSSAQATAVTLNGDDQTTTYSLGLTVNDPRGSGAGWNLTISSTQFTGTTVANKLDPNASSIQTQPSFACISGGGHCTNPSDTVSTPLTINATAVEFFNAAANTGLGKFTVTPTISIAIPANTIADTYTSTVTVAVVSGP